MNSKTALFIKYIIGFLIASAIFFVTIGLRNIYEITDQKLIFRFLSDGFSVPGVMFISLYLLIWFSNLGSLDGIGYAMKHLISMLIPFIQKKHETYSQYIETKKPANGFGFLLVIGLVFLAAGVVFTILFFI